MNLASASSHDVNRLQADANTAALLADVSSSSFDESHIPSSVLSKDHHSFWLSSGMFPQFLRLTLREPMPLMGVDVTCRHVKRLCLRCSPSKTINALNPNWSQSIALDVSATESEKIQTQRVTFRDRELAEVVEIVIESGYGDFAVVHFVRLRGADTAESMDSSR